MLCLWDLSVSSLCRRQGRTQLVCSRARRRSSGSSGLTQPVPISSSSSLFCQAGSGLENRGNPRFLTSLKNTCSFSPKPLSPVSAWLVKVTGAALPPHAGKEERGPHAAASNQFKLTRAQSILTHVSISGWLQESEQQVQMPRSQTLLPVTQPWARLVLQHRSQPLPWLFALQLDFLPPRALWQLLHLWD